MPSRLALLLMVPALACCQDGQAPAAHRPGHIDPAYQHIAEATGGGVYLIDPASSEEVFKQLGKRMAADSHSTTLVCGSPHPLRETELGRSEFFRITPVPGTQSLDVRVSGGQGESSVLLAQEQLPTLDHHDLASPTAAQVKVRLPLPTSGTWYINAIPMGPGKDRQILVTCLP